MEKAFQKKSAFLLLAAELIVFFVLCYTYFPYTPDDGFIYLYGARQLAQGQIPNYTPGELPTNAFGSHLWMLLLAPAYILSVPPLVWAKVIGLMLLLATAYTAGKILLELNENLPAPHSFAASYTLICYPFMVACAVNVLDTILASFSLVLSLHLAIRILKNDKGYLAAGLAIGFLISARPDSFLGALVLAAVLAYFFIRKKPKTSWRAGGLFAAGLLPGLFFFAMISAAYGEVLPNSAAAKAPAVSDLLSLAIYKRAFFLFINDFSRDAVLYLVYLALIPFCWLNKKKIVNVLFVSLALIHLLVFLLVKDWMGIHRLYLPSIVVAITAFLSVLAAILKDQRRILLPVAIMVLTLPMGYSHWKYYLGYNYAYPGAPSEKMGRFIAEHKFPDSYLMTCDMGVVPYYADIPTIDSNDAPICNRWRRKHLDDMEYLFEHKLDFIIMVNHQVDGAATPVFSINGKLFYSRYFRENYVRAGVATWRPSIEHYKERGFSIGYGRYFHLYVSKKMWNSLEEKKFITF